MTFARRTGTVVASVLLTVGLIGAGPADAARDKGAQSGKTDRSSWSDTGQRDTSWGRG